MTWKQFIVRISLLGCNYTRGDGIKYGSALLVYPESGTQGLLTTNELDIRLGIESRQIIWRSAEETYPLIEKYIALIKEGKDA